MIDRYTRPEMAALWTKERRFQSWLEVELNATDAWVQLGKVPAEAAKKMRENARFTVERIEEIEQTTRHDVVAFTRCVAESLGDESKYLHFGLTSTDVVDTALSSLLSKACDILEDDVRAFIDMLARQAKKYKMTPCMGRTHGVHAEPTTLGLKFALWYAEMQRNLDRLQHAHRTIAVGKISGAVGTYANVDPFVERYVCEHMGLEASPISTQVLQRDRHAELMTTLAIIASSLEKFATEVRGLQKTELREWRSRSARGRRAPARCRTSATPSTASRSAAWRASSAAIPSRRWRTSRCGTSATSRTRRPSASSCRTRRSCWTTCSASCAASWATCSSTRRTCCGIWTSPWG